MWSPTWEIPLSLSQKFRTFFPLCKVRWLNFFLFFQFFNLILLQRTSWHASVHTLIILWIVLMICLVLNWCLGIRCSFRVTFMMVLEIRCPDFWDLAALRSRSSEIPGTKLTDIPSLPIPSRLSDLMLARYHPLFRLVTWLCLRTSQSLKKGLVSLCVRHYISLALFKILQNL